MPKQTSFSNLRWYTRTTVILLELQNRVFQTIPRGPSMTEKVGTVIVRDYCTLIGLNQKTFENAKAFWLGPSLIALDFHNNQASRYLHTSGREGEFSGCIKVFLKEVATSVACVLPRVISQPLYA